MKNYLCTIVFLIVCQSFSLGQILTDGYYKVRNQESTKKYYLKVDTDSIFLYKNKDSQFAYKVIVLPEIPHKFVQSSFDLDIISIPFKVRPTINGFPNQLVTNFNGGVFIGIRTDIYKISASKTPYRKPSLNTSHFGYSIGIFGGFGATTINPYVTDNKTAIEYEGLVFNKGLAAIIAIKNINFGVGLGFDNLLDKNHADWLYQNKPWVGLVVALNLN